MDVSGSPRARRPGPGDVLEDVEGEVLDGGVAGAPTGGGGRGAEDAGECDTGMQTSCQQGRPSSQPSR